MKFFRHLLVLSGLGLSAGALWATGRGSFPLAHGGHQLTIWHYEPAGVSLDAPVLFVIHGVGRNAEDYLNDWIGQADQQRCLLVVPEFSKAEFPGEAAFNSGNLFTAAGDLKPRDEWSFSMIEPAFDAVRARLGYQRNEYLLYGHSAGAQFVQRFLYFVPEARCARYLAANAGWYMLPTFSEPFPYGLKGTPADAAALRRAFARPVVILLGEADTDAAHPSLRHTPESDAQGLDRLSRGKNFFAHARADAAAMAAPFHWTLATAPGTAHVNRDMAPFAARELFPN